MNDHVAKLIDKERLVLCLGHLGSGDRGRRQRQRTWANWSRRGAISSGGGSLELIVQVLRRFVPDMPLRPARTPARRGRCPAAPRPCIPSRAARPPLAPAPLADRASELEQALRADRCAAWKSSPASASTNCAPVRCLPAPPAGDVRRRRRSRRAEPRRGGQSRQGFRRTRGSPASAAACRANNAMGVIRRYS